jgi:phage baseplate assembly protein gpV
MADEAVKIGATTPITMGSSGPPPDKKVFGVSIATVLNNIDCTNQARVMLMLPWLPGYTPWARLSSPMAGMGRGTYFVPQIGDEVLVAFNHGDVREPYVLGTCWNTIDRPPALAPTDPVTKRKIRTPLGHELSFDEALQSVTLTSNTMSTVTLDPLKAQLSTPLASVTIDKAGGVTIKGATKITLDAPVIELKAGTLLSLRSSGAAMLKAAATLFLKGALVKIN